MSYETNVSGAMAPVHIMLTVRCQREIPVAFMTSLIPTGELSRALRGRWWDSCIIFWIGVKAGVGPLASVCFFHHLCYMYIFCVDVPSHHLSAGRTCRFGLPNISSGQERMKWKEVLIFFYKIYNILNDISSLLMMRQRALPRARAVRAFAHLHRTAD